MNFFFEYIWFRISKVYRKEDTDGITGSGFLALSQAIFIGDLNYVIMYWFGFESFIKNHSSQFAIAEMGLMLGLIVINHVRYRKRYNEYSEFYKMEPRTRSVIKGFFVVLFLVTPFIIGYKLVE